MRKKGFRTKGYEAPYFSWNQEQENATFHVTEETSHFLASFLQISYRRSMKIKEFGFRN